MFPKISRNDKSTKIKSIESLGRKAIAPLIASLILIFFAVAIGVTVMSFGRAQVELEAECSININLQLKTICYNQATKSLSFTVTNGANIDVDGLVVNVIGTQKAETSQLNDASIFRREDYTDNVKYDVLFSGEIRQVKITPKIVLFEEEQICPEKAVVVENVRNC